MEYMFYEKKDPQPTQEKIFDLIETNCSKMEVKVCHVFDKAKSLCTIYAETKNLFMNEYRYRFKVKWIFPIKVL